MNKLLKTINALIDHDLTLLVQWLTVNKINLNTTKTEILIFQPKGKSKTRHMNFITSSECIKAATTVNYVDVILHEYTISKIVRRLDDMNFPNRIFAKETPKIASQSLMIFFKNVNRDIRQTTRNSVTLPQLSTECFLYYFIKYLSVCIWNSMQLNLSIIVMEVSTSNVKSVLVKYLMVVI